MSSDLQSKSSDKEVLELYVRFVRLQRKLVRIQAELDNVRELIRQQGV